MIAAKKRTSRFTGRIVSVPAASYVPAVRPFVNPLPPSQRSKEDKQDTDAARTNSLWALGRLIRERWVHEYHIFEMKTRRRQSSYGGGHITRWDGGKCPSTGRTFQEVWTGLARFALQNELEPAEWMRAIFYSWKLAQHRNPTPNDLKSAATLKSYRDREPQVLASLRLTFDSDKRAFTQYVRLKQLSPITYSDLEILRMAIQTPETSLSPLFRYAVAYRAKQQDLLDRFWQRAVMQYAFDHKKYDLVWGDVVPADVRCAASQLTTNLKYAGDGSLSLYGGADDH